MADNGFIIADVTREVIECTKHKVETQMRLWVLIYNIHNVK